MTWQAIRTSLFNTALPHSTILGNQLLIKCVGMCAAFKNKYGAGYRGNIRHCYGLHRITKGKLITVLAIYTWVVILML